MKLKKTDILSSVIGFSYSAEYPYLTERLYENVLGLCIIFLQ